MTILDIPLKQIEFAEDEAGLLNPRGEIRDAGSLQDSILIAGQNEPIQVVQVAEKRYLVIDGHRRVVAARVMKWKTIRAELKDVPATPEAMIAAMLTSNVRENFNPSALGRAIARLSKANAWGIERVAKLCGLPVDHAQLLIDLAVAPESVQKRVDSGEMSLSAWKVLRDKPREVQEVAAALERPTVTNCRATVRQSREQPPSGVLADMLDQMNGEHSVVAVLNGAKATLLAEWHRMTEGERNRASAVIEAMHSFVVERSELKIGA